MRRSALFLFTITLSVFLPGCLCIPQKTVSYAIDAPDARRDITCYTPAFPPLTAIEFHVDEITFQINNKLDRMQIVICVPEGNTLRINPNGIHLLSEDKAIQDEIEIVLMRIIDHTGKRKITAAGPVRIEGATKKVFGLEGHRRLELRATFTRSRPVVQYLAFPPLWINGSRIDVPLVTFTRRIGSSC